MRRAAAVDCKGNARLQGGDAFEVDISGPASTAPAATVDDNLDGCAAPSPEAPASYPMSRMLTVTTHARLRFQAANSLVVLASCFMAA
jgi:hypothetical protein